MNYIVNFENGTSTSFKSKRELAAVVAYVRADGEHDIWSKHSSRAAARKFISSPLAGRLLDHETIFGLRENMSDELRAKTVRKHEREASRPDRPMRFYIADAIIQD